MPGEPVIHPLSDPVQRIGTEHGFITRRLSSVGATVGEFEEELGNPKRRLRMGQTFGSFSQASQLL